MSAAILTEAEAMERQAQEMLDVIHHCTTWEERLRAEDRIEELREDAASIKARIESSREHIRNYYGLDLKVGLEVTHEGRPGRIVGFTGQYVEVQHEGEEHTTTCHATSGMDYPEGTRIGPGPDERFVHLVEVEPA
jgi:seryl-tRNA synthetase